MPTLSPPAPCNGLPDTTLVVLAVKAMKTTLATFPGGATAIGQQLNKAGGVLSNELNESQPNHKLGLLDAVCLMHITSDVQMLKAMAACLNHAVVDLGDSTANDDHTLLDSYAYWHSCIGQVSRAVSTTLGADSVTREMISQVRLAGMAQIHQFFAFLTRLEALIDKE